MPRGRPPIRRILQTSPRRVGRPPRTERGLSASNNRRGISSTPIHGIPYGAVICSNFRRGRGTRPLNTVSPRTRSYRRRSGRIQRNVMANRGETAVILLNDPSVVDNYTSSAVHSDQPSSSSSDNDNMELISNGSTADGASCSGTAGLTLDVVVRGPIGNVNLVTLIDSGGGTGVPTTVKDLVSSEKFKKLPFTYQQYLLRMLPACDRLKRPHGILEPTFSALKNEYLSAALVDFNERLYAGETSPTPEIMEAIVIESMSVSPQPQQLVDTDYDSEISEDDDLVQESQSKKLNNGELPKVENIDITNRNALVNGNCDAVLTGVVNDSSSGSTILDNGSASSDEDDIPLERLVEMELNGFRKHRVGRRRRSPRIPSMQTGAKRPATRLQEAESLPNERPSPEQPRAPKMRINIREKKVFLIDPSDDNRVTIADDKKILIERHSVNGESSSHSTTIDDSNFFLGALVDCTPYFTRIEPVNGTNIQEEETLSV